LVGKSFNKPSSSICQVTPPDMPSAITDAEFELSAGVLAAFTILREKQKNNTQHRKYIIIKFLIFFCEN